MSSVRLPADAGARHVSFSCWAFLQRRHPPHFAPLLLIQCTYPVPKLHLKLEVVVRSSMLDFFQKKAFYDASILFNTLRLFSRFNTFRSEEIPFPLQRVDICPPFRLGSSAHTPNRNHTILLHSKLEVGEQGCMFGVCSKLLDAFL